MAKMTYGKLDKMLRSLGFSVQMLNGKARGYMHQESGARISLPKLADSKVVLPYHLAAVHITLKSYGISEPESFAAIVPN